MPNGNLCWTPENIVSFSTYKIRFYETALDNESSTFINLQGFSNLSKAKVNSSILIKPQIKKFIECKKFPMKLTKTKREAWNSFVAVDRGLLRNHKQKTMKSMLRPWSGTKQNGMKDVPQSTFC